jgi:hypothetical protein
MSTDADHLFQVLYAELRSAARRQLARGSPGDTLNTTALVHEAYLKLVRGRTSARPRHCRAHGRVHSAPNALEPPPSSGLSPEGMLRESSVGAVLSVLATSVVLRAQDPRLAALVTLRPMGLDTVDGAAAVYFRPASARSSFRA